MILCCGEALIDMLPRETTLGEKGFAPYAGGAIFNTAIALGRLGIPTAFFTGLADDMMGEILLDTLKARGKLENTIVIISSDHGEEFGEHGRLGHGISLYRTSVQVPLIVLAPRCENNGHREASPVSLHDLPATAMELLQLGPHPFPGQSFAPLVCDPSAEPAPHVVFSVLRESARPGGPTLVTVAADSFRFISAGDSLDELYNVIRDPLEQTNLARTPIGALEIPRLRPLADSIRNLPQGRP